MTGSCCFAFGCWEELWACCPVCLAACCNVHIDYPCHAHNRHCSFRSCPCVLCAELQASELAERKRLRASMASEKHSNSQAAAASHLRSLRSLPAVSEIDEHTLVLPNAIPVFGGLHISHTSMAYLTDCLPHFEEHFKKDLTHVVHFLGGRHLRERFIAQCLDSDRGKVFVKAFEAGSLTLCDWRWGELHNAACHISVIDAPFASLLEY